MTKHFLFAHGSQTANLRRWERSITLGYETIVCVDSQVERSVRKWAQEEGVDRDIHFIPNSVDTTECQPKPMPPFDRLRVGFAGRLDQVRGEAFLRRFLASLPDFVEFHGALGTSADRFAGFSRQFRSDRIHLARNVSSKELPLFFGRVHVLLNPLEIDGAVGRSSLEAMAFGRPVLMFNDADRQPLVHGETGFVCRRDVEETSAFLRSLWEQPEFIEKVGREARQLVEREFSHSKVMPVLKRLYDRLAGNSR